MFFESWRYREVSTAIAGALTRAALERVDKTLTDAYSKAVAQGAKPEDMARFNQQLIDKTNELLSRENGVRIRQWTEAIIEQEPRSGLSIPEALLLVVGAFLLGRLFRK